MTLSATALAACIERARGLGPGPEIRGDLPKARALLRGLVVYRRHRVAVDWDSFAHDLPADFPKAQEKAWLFFLHGLQWAEPLRLRADDLAGRNASALFERILGSWLRRFGTPPPRDALPTPAAPGDFTWFDMSTSWRTGVLARALPAVSQPADLIAHLAAHRDLLKLDGYYVGQGNHALHQNNALLQAAHVLGDAAGMALAAERTNALLAENIDAEGVVLEGAPAYQVFNADWWAQTRVLHDRIGVPLTGGDRIGRMADFLVYALDFEQQFYRLGDTPRKQHGFLADGRRDCGPELERQVKAHPLFGHRFLGAPAPGDDWPATRHFCEGIVFSNRVLRHDGAPTHSALVAKADGPVQARPHGHEDHGSFIFHACGERVIEDQGMYGYYGGRARGHVKGAAAHNVVLVEGAQFYRSATSSLSLTESATTDIIDMDIRALEGTRWHRRIHHFKDRGAIRVEDRVASSLPGAIRQILHLGDDFRPRPISDGLVLLERDGGCRFCLRFSGPGDLRLLHGSTSPYMGWRSTFENEIHPAHVLIRDIGHGRAEAGFTIEPAPPGM
jgi:hypothetical protein